MKAHPDESELAARIQSYELAYRMQTSAAEAVDLDRESPQTRAMYGLDKRSQLILAASASSHADCWNEAYDSSNSIRAEVTSKTPGTAITTASPITNFMQGKPINQLPH